MPDEQPLKRWFPRRKVSLPCWVRWQDRQAPARSVDVSYAGVGILLSEAVDVNVEVLIQVPEESSYESGRCTLSGKTRRITMSDARSSSSSGGSSNG